MLECLRAHIRNDKTSNITRYYEKLAKKKGNSRAAFAAASKLLKVAYWIMKDRRENIIIIIVKVLTTILGLRIYSLVRVNVASLNKWKTVVRRIQCLEWVIIIPIIHSIRNI